jgi:ADP-ribose pyrophosphatase YjhB (NUDIX family)
MPFTYAYPRAALTVDCVVFGFDGADLKILLIQRGVAPFLGNWALPGGFVQVTETLDDAARRELAEEAGLTQVFLEQLYSFSGVDRDPRERVVSVAYYALVKLADHPTMSAGDASDAAWFRLTRLPPLAFDHAEIVKTALERLRTKVRYQPIGFELLPKQFTLSELQDLYEGVLRTAMDKRNFRKKILAMGLLIPLNGRTQVGAHRPAQLFRFDAGKYAALKKRGFNFEL